MNTIISVITSVSLSLSMWLCGLAEGITCIALVTAYKLRQLDRWLTLRSDELQAFSDGLGVNDWLLQGISDLSYLAGYGLANLWRAYA